MYVTSSLNINVEETDFSCLNHSLDAGFVSTIDVAVDMVVLEKVFGGDLFLKRLL